MDEKIIIAPSYARKQEMENLVEKDGFLFGTQVLSLNAYKSSNIINLKSRDNEYTRLFVDIQNHISKKNKYYNQLIYPSFFNYFYNFANLLVSYDISIDEIEEDDKKEILEFILEKDLIQKQLKKGFEEVEDCTNIEIHDYFYPNYYDHLDIEKLKAKNATFIENKYNKNTKFTCRYANNKVKEVLGVAQYLLSLTEGGKPDFKDYALYLCDLDSYLPIIKRVFKHYNIPFKIEYNVINNSAQKFLSLLDLIRNQDINSFVNAYNHKVFKISNYQLVKYISELELTYEQILVPFDNATKLNDKIISEKDREILDNAFGNGFSNILYKERIAEEIMQEIRKIICDKRFIELKNKSLKEQTSYAYSYLFGKLNKDEIPVDEFNEISDIHELCLDIVSNDGEDKKVFNALKNRLRSLKIKKRDNYENGIKIEDVYHNVEVKNVIILGANQEVYPKSVALNSFFDEKYITKVESFPTLVERNNYFENAYDKLLHRFDSVIFSYSIGSVDGKQYQRSTLINNYVPKDEYDNLIEEAWLLQEENAIYDYSPSISKENAEKLYLKDGILKASPTSFEKFVKCPFNYFISGGLKPKVDKEYEIDAANIGDIRHHIFERWFKGDIKNLNDTNLDKELDVYFDLIKQVFVNQKDEIDGLKDRLSLGMIYYINFLNDFSKEDNYEYFPEHNINGVFEIDKLKFKINGYIDRLDINGNKYRIIDYKSSEKTVNVDKLKKGLDFQLLAYLVFYYLSQKNKDELEPELIGYLNLKYKTIDKKTNNDLSEEEMRKHNIKYESYSTAPYPPNEEYFANKSLGLDFSYLKKAIEDLYVAIGKDILSGNISVEPKGEKSPCTFCEYLKLCHYKGGEDHISKNDMPDLISIVDKGDNKDEKKKNKN